MKEGIESKVGDRGEMDRFDWCFERVFAWRV